MRWTRPSGDALRVTMLLHRYGPNTFNKPRYVDDGTVSIDARRPMSEQLHKVVGLAARGVRRR